MQECIKDEIVIPAARGEYTSATRVCDVRDYNPDAPAGVAVLGGLTAELIYTFTALYDWL